MAEKANPFAKLGKTEAPASRAKSTKAKAAAASEEAETEEEVVAAAKERVAAKRATRSVKAKAAPKPEEVEEVEEEEDDSADSEEVEAEKAAEPEDDDSDDDADDAAKEDEAAAEEPVKAAPKSTRRTAKQVEEEYQAKQAELEEQIAKLTARIESGEVGGGVEVVRDRVVLEDGVGGDLRVVGASRTLVNDDWRATVTDGIKLVVGRSSAQATNSFVIPVSLAKSLGELLAEIDEIAE